MQLEMVEGELWGNIWQTECIARVDPASGEVRGYILMQGLRRKTMTAYRQAGHAMDVLNGEASAAGRMCACCRPPALDDGLAPGARGKPAGPLPRASKAPALCYVPCAAPGEWNGTYLPPLCTLYCRHCV